MDNLYVELRTLHRGSVSHDIAQHLLTRQFLGKAVIITDKPIALASAVGKQWQQLMREVQRARSSTLQTQRVREMDREIEHMQSFKLLAQNQARDIEADALFTMPEDIGNLSKCQTLYVACKLSESAFTTLLQQMPPHAVVVRY